MVLHYLAQIWDKEHFMNVTMTSPDNNGHVIHRQSAPNLLTLGILDCFFSLIVIHVFAENINSLITEIKD